MSEPFTLLVAGLCSVGKSSFVSALWGDAGLLPTAVRDCTQTNTLLRAPEAGEAEPGLRLEFLPREAAAALACRGLPYLRLAEFLNQQLGPLGPNLDELLPEARLQAATRAVRALFQERPRLHVLHEPLTDSLIFIEELLAFLLQPEFSSGAVHSAAWETRREWLMGRRRQDGLLEGTGALTALRRVVLVRGTARWGAKPPQILDTPWIPAYHEARRTELILEEARQAQALALLALPRAFEPEEWVHKLWREQPAMRRRTFVIFNQFDTVDSAALFAPDGFARAFEANLKGLEREGIEPDRVFLACARLPFLELQAKSDPEARERAAKLKTRLAKIKATSRYSASGHFQAALNAVCASDDAGLESFRSALEVLRRKLVFP